IQRRSLRPRGHGDKMAAMSQFVLTPACKRLVALAGITAADLLRGDGQTRHSISRDLSLIMARWRPQDRIVLIDGSLKKGLLVNGLPVVEEMEPVLVLALKPWQLFSRVQIDFEALNVPCEAPQSY